MPRIRHSSNPGRFRARLLSTPTPPNDGDLTEGHHLMAGTTIEGVRFSDQLAALVDHAAASGWRVERDTRAKAHGLVLYPLDKTHRPVTVTEIGGKFNRAHYENVRRDLYHAGLPPLPSDRKTTITEEHDMSAKSRHNHVTEATLKADLSGPERKETLAGIVDGLFDRADLKPYAGLAAGLTYAIAVFAEESGSTLSDLAVAEVRAEMLKEMEEALQMAADAEARADRLQAALDKANNSERQARDDCKAALARAKTAEEKSAATEAALAPLRAILGK